jgi:hypothetical protein
MDLAENNALLQGEHGQPEQLAVCKDLCIVPMYDALESAYLGGWTNVFTLFFFLLGASLLFVWIVLTLPPTCK